MDTTVCINNNSKLTITLYKKETDRNVYLHYRSYHPLSLKDNIPFGQALRAKKICTDNADLENVLITLKINFIDRGYPSDVIQTQLTKATSVNRKELLAEKDKTESNHIRFNTTFNENLPNIRNILNKNWHLLQTNNKIASSFTEKPRNLC